MNSALLKKRKSYDALECPSQSKQKKDRWYEQEAVKEKDRPKDKRRLSAIGSFFSKIKSSSKLSSSTSSLNKNGSSHPTSEDNSFASNSEKSVSSYDSIPVKNNRHLKQFLYKADGTIDEQSNASSESIGSVGSLCTPVRGGIDRDCELRLSSRSMPAPTPQQENTVRRAYSTVASVSDSPSAWLRRKSMRLRSHRRDVEMEEVKEEEEVEIAIEGKTCTPSSSTVLTSLTNTQSTPLTSFGKTIDRSRSAAAYSVRKRASTHNISMAVGEGTVTPDQGLTHSKLTPSSNSTSTLQRIGGLIKRGLSSGSRSQKTPVQPIGSESTDALVSIMRRQTMDRKRRNENGRRMSDISSYGDVSMQQTPRGDESKRYFESEALTSEFSTKVTVARNGDELIERPTFDVFVVDVFPDGRPASNMSHRLVTRFNCRNEIMIDVQKNTQKKAGVVTLSGQGKPSHVIWIGVRESDRAKQMRMGYDAALQIAFHEETMRNVLLPQLFVSSSELLTKCEYPDAIVRSTYKVFVNRDNHLMMDSIVIIGEDSDCVDALQDCLDRLMSEKVNRSTIAMQSGSSFRR